MGRDTTVAYKRLASRISIKREQPYSTAMSWLRCRLSFSLLRSAIYEFEVAIGPVTGLDVSRTELGSLINGYVNIYK